MRMLLLPFTPRYIVLTLVLGGTAALAALVYWDPGLSRYFAVPLVLFGFLALVGLRDLIQTKHAILRSYPIAAHMRFILEAIRPEIRQYFLESDKDGAPFPRDKRADRLSARQGRADKRPFGTEYDVYGSRYEWLHHSIAPEEPASEPFRIFIGGPACTSPIPPPSSISRR